MNVYFYKVWLPLHLIFFLSIPVIFLNTIEINWLIVFCSWILIGPVGLGVGFHRLFSHRQFETYRPIEIALAILGTLSCYSPILFWIGQHQTHHKKADSLDDIQTPKHGFIESFLMWRLREGIEKEINPRDYCTRQIMKDNLLMKIGNNTISIIYVWAIFLLLISPSAFFSVLIIPAIIESFRINLINYYGHKPGIFSYRNFNTEDASYNNLLLGLFGFGVGWHNNHHANPQELINKKNWWEIDLEGFIGKLLSKKFFNVKIST